MSNSVCLTARQQKFYNYFINFYKSNGHFPNPSLAARELDSSSPSVNAMYGVLLQKGAFTGGQPLTNSYRARHTATAVPAANIANLKITVKQKAPKPAAKPKLNRRDMATLLVKLLSEQKIDMDKVAQMFA